METHANYRLVGTFVLALIVGLLAFVVWLAGVQLTTRYTYYDIYFPGSVTGLKVDGPVSYRGITVGRVRDIAIDPTNVERVRVTIEVRPDTPIRQDSVASLEVEGLVGATFVLLSGGSQSALPLTAESGQRYPVIASKLSSISAVIESAPRVADQLERLLQQLTALTRPENVESIEASLRHVETFTEAMAAGAGDVGDLFRQARAVAADLRAASQSFEQLATDLSGQTARITERAESTMGAIDDAAVAVTGAVRDIAREVPATLNAVDDAASAFTGTVGPVGRDLPAAIAEVRQAARDISRAADGLAVLIAENREPLHEFTSVGLTEFARLLADTREAVTRFGRVAKETEADPQRFLFGDLRGGYDVPQ